MNFPESEAYLLSLGNEVSAMKLGLENIRQLLAAFGDPQNNYLKVQIAGTNGKGSVCAFVGSICREAGVNAGVYTSPHLVSITERINIKGENISEDKFAELATVVRDNAEAMLADGELEYRPTFFEHVTAIALLAFADAKVDLAILETGLGGRLDATTAANAEICGITRIDIDHQEYLGTTIEEIAAEKAAIIRPDSIVVVGEQQPVAMNVIVDRCNDVGVSPTVASNEVGFTGLGLYGRHQIENASIAIRIVEILRKHFVIDDEHVTSGLKNTLNPGRLEFNGRYLFDGAHNVGGAIALRTYLEEFIDVPITIIFGIMRDKDWSMVLKMLLPFASKLILTTTGNERSMSPAEIATRLPDDPDMIEVVQTNDVDDAILFAEEHTDEHGIILVTGSLYLIGEVKQYLAKRDR